MSEAPHQPSPAAPETNTTLMEPQDQAPTGNSQENSSSSLGSEAVSEFDSSDDTLRPSGEIQEEEGSGIDRDVWIDTLPFPDCAPPSPCCSKLQRSVQNVHTEPELQTSSLGQNERLANGHPETQAERMTFNTAPFTLDWGVPDSFLDGNEFFQSSAPHQCFEDGMRTPPRPLATEAQPNIFNHTVFHGKCKQQQQRLFDAGKMGLFYTLTSKHDRTQPKTAVLNLVALQRINVHGLQERLASHAAEGFNKDLLFMTDWETRQRLLNLYCKCFGPVPLRPLTRSRRRGSKSRPHEGEREARI